MATNNHPKTSTGCWAAYAHRRLACRGSDTAAALHEVDQERVDFLRSLVVRTVADARKRHHTLDALEALSEHVRAAPPVATGGWPTLAAAGRRS